VDLVALAALVGDDEATQRQMLEGFLRAADHARRKIEGAWRVGDVEALCGVAHGLQASAAALGAATLLGASRAVEAARANPSAIAPLVEHLVKSLQRVIADLDAYRRR
jgi:hypothetical protein